MWEEGPSTEPRFGVDQWHLRKDGLLLELERWPDQVDVRPGFYRVFMVKNTAAGLVLIYRERKADISPEQAQAWAEQEHRKAEIVDAA